MDKDTFGSELSELTAEALEDLSAATVLGVLVTHVRVLIGAQFGVDDYDDGGSERFRVDDDLR